MATKYLIADTPSLQLLQYEISLLEKELQTETSINHGVKEDTLKHTLEWIDTRLETHYLLTVYAPLDTLERELELICIRPDFDVYVESESEHTTTIPLASLTEGFLENKKLSKETSGVYKCLAGARSFQFKIYPFQGQFGLMDIFVIVNGSPLSSHVLQIHISPLAFYRPHTSNLDVSGKENQLTITSESKPSEIHDWVTRCFQVPPILQVVNSIDLFLRSEKDQPLCGYSFISSLTLKSIIVHPSRSGCTIYSDSPQSILVLKKQLLKEAELVKKRIELKSDVKIPQFKALLQTWMEIPSFSLRTESGLERELKAIREQENGLVDFLDAAFLDILAQTHQGTLGTLTSYTLPKEYVVYNVYLLIRELYLYRGLEPTRAWETLNHIQTAIAHGVTGMEDWSQLIFDPVQN